MSIFLLNTRHSVYIDIVTLWSKSCAITYKCSVHNDIDTKMAFLQSYMYLTLFFFDVWILICQAYVFFFSFLNMMIIKFLITEISRLLKLRQSENLAYLQADFCKLNVTVSLLCSWNYFSSVLSIQFFPAFFFMEKIT